MMEEVGIGSYQETGWFKVIQAIGENISKVCCFKKKEEHKHKGVDMIND